MSGCLAETCANWTGHGCACAVMDVVPACVPCQMGETCRDHDPAGDGGRRLSLDESTALIRERYSDAIEQLARGDEDGGHDR